MVWWCSYGVVAGDHIEDIEDKDVIPDWCPLYDVDPTILRVLADRIFPGPCHDDLIKLAGYLEGEDEDTQD
jgi:5,10-methenyltetrahydromethanopterin hydrogenase